MESTNKVHHFDIELAEELSIESAVLYANLSFWIKKNKANNKHLHDGKYWSYNSISAFEELFPYMSRHKITKALEELENNNYLEVGNFNKSSYDRTKWYSTPATNHFRISEMEYAKNGNGLVEKREPIPYNKPDTKHIYIGKTENLDEKTFLEMWSRARLHYDKKPTNISKLGFNERSDFEQLIKDYSLKDFEYAIAGMFFQDTLPNVRVRPTHFLKLEYFETYLDCWKNKTKLFTKQTKKNDNTGMI